MRLDYLTPGEEFRLYMEKPIYRLKKIVEKPYKFAVATNEQREDEYFHVDTAVTIVHRLSSIENHTKFIHNSRWYEVSHTNLVRCLDCATRNEIFLHPNTEVIV